jgi:hypothetical protein
VPDPRRVSDELAGSAGLTARQNTFAKREAVMAWAAAHGQGAPARVVERAAAEFLTRVDVHRAPDLNERRFTTSDLLADERAIVHGAQVRRDEGIGRLDRGLVDAVLAAAPFAPTAEQAAVIRGLTSSGHGVETVEALAGTGKTFTAGLLAQAYTAGGFRVLGTAPTGRAVRELTEQAGIAQAWTLTRLALDLDDSGFGNWPAVLILDEAGMASTRETARVLGHAGAAGVKVIAIGDSGQLSSVQAGGWLGSLTVRLGSHELREIMRQRDARERQLLAHVHRGDPTDYITEKHNRGQLRIFVGDIETARIGERAAIAAWRDRQAACPWGQAVLIARDNDRRERLNALVRAELRCDGRLGESIHVAGVEFAVGDRVVARQNDRLLAVDNGTRGTVIAVDPTEKDVVVRTDAGAQRTLDAAYVTEHLQHAYALTAHTIQGGAADWAGVVGRPEDFTRNWSYTALSRAREASELFLIDTPTDHELDRAEIAPDQALELDDQRTAVERLEAAMRRRDDESLALDRIDDIGAQPPTGRHFEPPTGRHFADANAAAAIGLSRRSVDELRTELAQLHERIGRYPEHLAEQLHAARSARAEAQCVADVARERIAQLEQPTGGACCADGPRIPPRLPSSADASSSPSTTPRRPPSASATSRAGSQTAPHGRPNASRSASAPPSSRCSCRCAAKSTCATRWSAPVRTYRRRWARYPTSRGLAVLGSKPPRTSRPTASTTPSRLPATPWARPRPTLVSERIGNTRAAACGAPSVTSVSASTADPRTSSDIDAGRELPLRSRGRYHAQPAAWLAITRRQPPMRRPTPRRHWRPRRRRRRRLTGCRPRRRR